MLELLGTISIAQELNITICGSLLKVGKKKHVRLKFHIPAGLCLCVAYSVLCGCSWTDSSGTHHLIVGVGFGIITTTNKPGLEVQDSHVLGAEGGLEGAGIGWIQHHRIIIDPALASNVVVSVNANPFGLMVKNFDPYLISSNVLKGMKGKKTNQ